jgi:hypothetical protein
MFGLLTSGFRTGTSWALVDGSRRLKAILELLNNRRKIKGFIELELADKSRLAFLFAVQRACPVS